VLENLFCVERRVIDDRPARLQDCEEADDSVRCTRQIETDVNHSPCWPRGERSPGLLRGGTRKMPPQQTQLLSRSYERERMVMIEIAVTAQHTIR